MEIETCRMFDLESEDPCVCPWCFYIDGKAKRLPLEFIANIGFKISDLGMWISDQVDRFIPPVPCRFDPPRTLDVQLELCQPLQFTRLDECGQVDPENPGKTVKEWLDHRNSTTVRVFATDGVAFTERPEDVES